VSVVHSETTALEDKQRSVSHAAPIRRYKRAWQSAE